MATEAKPRGHIHAGSTITPGGRYDRFLAFLRAHPGATTLEIIHGTGLCAVSAIASELRALWRAANEPKDIQCRYERMTEVGSKVHRYWYIQSVSLRLVTAPKTVREGELF